MSAITSPPFFEKYILPSLKKQAELLHRKNKYLLTHTDGENRGLLELFVKSGFDVADSICPAPLTSLTLKEILRVFGGKIAVWGGIPSISVLEESMNNAEFEACIDSLFESIGKDDRVILSIADTVPPGASFERIDRIAKKTKEFNAYRGAGHNKSS